MKKTLITISTLALCMTAGAAPVTKSTAHKVTAMNQGGSASDAELTRKIREEIVSDKNLSMRSKNVTIVSQDGVVTLRGSLPNTTEQMRVEEIAKKTAGAMQVINQTNISTSN